MDKNGVKMNILWPKQIWWQTCNYRKLIFGVNPVLFRFLKESAFLKSVLDCGFILKKSRGSLARFAGEGVRANLSHWI